MEDDDDTRRIRRREQLTGRFADGIELSCKWTFELLRRTAREWGTATWSEVCAFKDVLGVPRDCKLAVYIYDTPYNRTYRKCVDPRALYQRYYVQKGQTGYVQCDGCGATMCTEDGASLLPPHAAVYHHDETGTDLCSGCHGKAEQHPDRAKFKVSIESSSISGLVAVEFRLLNHRK